MQLLVQIPLFLLGGLVGLAIGRSITTIVYAIAMYIYVYNIYGVRIKSENIYLLSIFLILFVVLIIAKLESLLILQFVILLIISVLLCGY